MVGERLQTTARYTEDPCNIFGKNVAAKLRSLSKETRLYTEKLINDLLFEAEMGNINKNTRIVTSPDVSKNVDFDQLSPRLNPINNGQNQYQFPRPLTYPREPVLHEMQPRSHIYQPHSGSIVTQVSPENQEENDIDIAAFFGNYRPNNGI